MFVAEAFVSVDGPLEVKVCDRAGVGGLVVCSGCVSDFVRFLGLGVFSELNEPPVYKESFYDVLGDKVHEFGVEAVSSVEDARDTSDIVSM